MLVKFEHLNQYDDNELIGVIYVSINNISFIHTHNDLSSNIEMTNGRLYLVRGNIQSIADIINLKYEMYERNR